MDRIIIVGVGGFLGAVLRYLIAGWTQGLVGDRFPLGTLCVNVAGCFVLGALAGASDGQGALSPTMRLFLFVGVIGGFTTFSAFGYETVALISAGRIGAAAASVTGNLVLGIPAVWLGAMASRAIVG